VIALISSKSLFLFYNHIIACSNLLFSNELGVNNKGTPVAVKHGVIKHVGKQIYVNGNYHPDLMHPESISFDSTFTDSIVSEKTYTHVLPKLNVLLIIN